MIVGATPILLAKVCERSESTGYDELATMLCGSPIAWPISWVMTCSIASSISSSVSGSWRASGLAAPVCTIIQLR